MKTLITFAAVALLSVTSFAQETQQKKASLSDAEQLHIAVQKICPVSGQELGSMGDPIQAEDGIRDPLWSRGLGDVYKRQTLNQLR